MRDSLQKLSLDVTKKIAKLVVYSALIKPARTIDKHIYNDIDSISSTVGPKIKHVKPFNVLHSSLKIFFGFLFNAEMFIIVFSKYKNNQFILKDFFRIYFQKKQRIKIFEKIFYRITVQVNK